MSKPVFALIQHRGSMRLRFHEDRLPNHQSGRFQRTFIFLKVRCSADWGHRLLHDAEHPAIFNESIMSASEYKQIRFLDQTFLKSAPEFGL